MRPRYEYLYLAGHDENYKAQLKPQTSVQILVESTNRYRSISQQSIIATTLQTATSRAKVSSMSAQLKTAVPQAALLLQAFISALGVTPVLGKDHSQGVDVLIPLGWLLVLFTTLVQIKLVETPKSYTLIAEILKSVVVSAIWIVAVIVTNGNSVFWGVGTIVAISVLFYATLISTFFKKNPNIATQLD
ncbi:hypothetical protein VTL71DRAFT_12207, partial [Oculimacula yallundae]